MAKGQDTKESLVNAAIRLFAESGIHWVSFQQIAKQVGVSQPSLYRHFRDKDDLILACAIKAASDGRILIDSHVNQLASANTQLKEYIDGNFLWVETKRNDAVMILAIYYFANNSIPMRNTFHAINGVSLERLAVRIAAGQREGIWAKSDPAKSARAIHNLLIGEMIKMAHAPEEFTRRERLNITWQTVQKLLTSAS